MFKNETREDAIKELEKNNSIEILSEELEEREFKEIIEKLKQKKSEFLKETEERGYSEFMSGVVFGMILREEEKLMKNRWIPSFMKK